MAEQIQAQADWDNKVIQTEPTILSPNDYEIQIVDRNDVVYTDSPNTLRYNPQMNAANKLRCSVNPDDIYVDEPILSGLFRLYINSSKIFEGEIKAVTTNRSEESFELTVHSPGLKLDGGTVEDNVNNEVTYDYIGKIIDYFNGVDSDHETAIATDIETLNDTTEIGGNVRAVSSGANTGTATYSNVGSDASALDTLYVKAYTPGNDYVDVDLSTGSNSFTHRIQGLDADSYGEWVTLDLGNTFDGDTGVYDIEFTIRGSAYLVNWRVVTDVIIDREIVAPEVSGIDTSVEIQNGDTQSSFEEIFTFENTDPFKIANNKLVPMQTGFVGEPNSGSGAPGVFERDYFTNGYARTIGDSDDSLIFDFKNEYDIEDAEIWLFSEIADTDDQPQGKHHGFDINLDGSMVDGAQSDAFLPGLEWRKFYVGDTISAGEHRLEIEWTSYSDYGSSVFESPRFDVCAVLDSNYDYTEDENVHAPEGYLDGPELYPDGEWVDADLAISDNNIESGTITVQMNEVTEDQALQLSFDGGETWIPQDGGQNNTSSVTRDIAFPSMDIKARVRMGRIYGDPQNDTPRFGYDSHEVTDWEVSVDTNNLSVLYDHRTSGSRLGAMSTIADDSIAVFRFEGYHCKIFQDGVETTNPNLVNETIKETRTIENAYGSAEAIGKHNVRSGKIVNPSAPNYVDDHTVIQDETLENRKDCTIRALNFLEKHGDVEYESSISTLPTFAPVGAHMDSSYFRFDEDLIIKSVSYSMNSTTIELGRTVDIGEKLVALNRKTHGTQTRVTGQGTTIPVGSDQFRP